MPDHHFTERLQPPHAENPEDRSVSYLRGLGHAFEAAFTQVVSKQKRPTGFVISYRPHRDGYRKGAQIHIQPSCQSQASLAARGFKQPASPVQPISPVASLLQTDSSPRQVDQKRQSSAQFNCLLPPVKSQELKSDSPTALKTSPPSTPPRAQEVKLGDCERREYSGPTPKPTSTPIQTGSPRTSARVTDAFTNNNSRSISTPWARLTPRIDSTLPVQPTRTSNSTL